MSAGRVTVNYNVINSWGEWTMRLKALLCGLAVAMLIAPAVRADECNRETFLTFSGPVQLPGLTLPAGTYKFKLADPGNGNLNAIGIWDKAGTHFYRALQTVRHPRMEAPKDPVVLFDETPAVQPQAVKAWFYPNERTGYEFIWPKDKAVQLAQATHTPVLTSSDESARDVSRIDERGAITSADSDDSAPA